jgi:hypothetical protein
MTEREYDSNDWVDETGASTGDRRENSPSAAGFTGERDRLFRSHFQHANQLADRGYEQVQPAYELGFTAAVNSANARRDFEEIEKDLESGWLSVRTDGGEWQSVRVFARAGFDAARQGSVEPFPETD